MLLTSFISRNTSGVYKPRSFPIPIIPNHSQSFPIIPNHSQSFPIIPNHSQSFPIIPNHSQSFPSFPIPIKHDCTHSTGKTQTKSFAKANTTPLTVNGMVQTEWTSPTGAVSSEPVKLDCSFSIGGNSSQNNHGECESCQYIFFVTKY